MRNNNCIYFFIFFGILFVLYEFVYANNIKNPIWIEDSFEDFRDGSFDDGGRDLYVTAKGVIKTVRRFDFNGDGHIDFPVNSSHNVNYQSPATLFQFQQEAYSIHELPVKGSVDAEVSDLNNDGFLDIVFVPNRNGVTPRRFLTIFWGGDDGWVNHRKTNLVTMYAMCVEIADLNKDGYKDIVVLNGSRWSLLDGPEKVVRIYWGSIDTYWHYDATDIIVDRAVDLKIFDVNDDGDEEIILLASNPGEIQIFNTAGLDRNGDPEIMNSSVIQIGADYVNRLVVSKASNSRHADFFAFGGQRVLLRGNPTTGSAVYNYTNVFFVKSKDEKNKWTRVSKIIVPPSSSFTVNDVDQDGSRDLILMNREQQEYSMTIFWGNESNQFISDQQTEFPVHYVSSVAFCDINTDGLIDIAAGVGRTDETFEGESTILLGRGARQFELSDIRIPTSEVNHALYVEEQNQLIFCNGRKARINEDVPVSIYWGDSSGFDTNDISSFDMQAGYSCAGADLNDDGFADMVQLSIVHTVHEDHPLLGFNIFWGDINGLHNSRRTNVHKYGAWGLEVVDINYDGYLDIVSAIEKPSPDGKEPTGLCIWHGSADGYLPHNRKMIQLEGRSVGNITADYNKDGWLDVAVIGGDVHKIRVLWGSDDGLSDSNLTEWSFPSPADLETADLNNDGWLDLLVTSHQLAPSIYWDYGTYIYWGSPEGFNPADAQQLPGEDGIGITVADWDADGFLDVLLPCYHISSTREAVAAQLFWGSSDGFNDNNRSYLMQDGAHDAMAVDFNHDGLLDILLINHTKDGHHNTESQLFFNDGKRFKNPVIQYLPTLGPHYMYRSDIGNLYHREFQQIYDSSIFQLKESAQSAEVHYKAEVPDECKLQLYLRAGQTRESLSEMEWVPVQKSNNNFNIRSQDRFFQYKVTFNSDNGDRYPELDMVMIEFESE